MADQTVIHGLVLSDDVEKRKKALNDLQKNFVAFKDKTQAWTDLLALTKDSDGDVQLGAALALGIAFSQVTDKMQATNDLLALTKDKDSTVRAYAYHSLGEVHVFKATEADEKNFRSELEKALEFFESSSREQVYSNPAKFCLPFYRSFYSITFKGYEAKEEVQKYLVEAKSAVEGSESSESKEKLLEAVENLSNALKEAQNVSDFHDRKQGLKACRLCIDRAEKLLENAKDEAPAATMLIRRGLTIIDERIKAIIVEIQEKAEALCKQVKDTEYKEIGQQVNNVGQELSKVIDATRLEKEVSRMLIPISAMCKKMPQEDRGEACEILKQINDEQNIEDKLPLISMFLSIISTQMNKKKEQSMGNIEIKNSKGAQVNIGKDNYQAQDSNSSNKKYLKKSLPDILNSSATVAAFIGFLAVEIGTYFYPLSYNHLISAVAATISFIIVALLNRR